LAEDGELRRRLGRNARRLVLARHTAAEWQAANLSIVAGMLERSRTGE
jgi:hypothetical protein